eukprot:366519-Chlamydomonas_euryale.AAC.17
MSRAACSLAGGGRVQECPGSCECASIPNPERGQRAATHRFQHRMLTINSVAPCRDIGVQKLHLAGELRDFEHHLVVALVARRSRQGCHRDLRLAAHAGHGLVDVGLCSLERVLEVAETLVESIALGHGARRHRLAVILGVGSAAREQLRRKTKKAGA